MDILKKIKTWHKIVAGIVGLLIVSVIMIVLIGIQSVKITESFSARVFLGNMSDKEAGHVMDVAVKELYEKEKYPFARDAFNSVLKYNKGDYRDDAIMWIGLTYTAEGDYVEAIKHYDTVIKDYPKSDVIEDHKLGEPLGGEIDQMFKQKPIDYPAITAYLSILEDASVPTYGDYKKRLGAFLDAPINMSANYAHEKELTYAVKKTAAEDAKKEALFHAKDHLPRKITKMLRKEINFGDVLSDEVLEEVIADNMVYGDKLESIKKATPGGVSGSELEKRKKEEAEENEKLYSDLPEDWASAFTAAEQDEGWAASAAVSGSIEGLTIREILEQAEINPVTGKPVR